MDFNAFGLLNISDSRDIYFSPFNLSDVDFSDGRSRGDLVIGIVGTLLVLVTLTVSVRIYTRAGITGRLFADDILMIVALACSIVFFTTTIANGTAGLGKHIWSLNLARLQGTLQRFILLLYVGHISTQCAILFTKLSILVLYHRLFPDRWMRRLCYGLGAFFVVFYVASIFAVVFQCTPVEATWRLDLPATCFDFVKVLYAIAAVNIATDVVLCVMPMSHFFTLQLPRRQKIILSILFLGGGVACIAAIMRITTLRHLYDFDITFKIVDSLLWSVLEVSLGIICVSIPALRPLFVRLFPNILRTYGRSTRRGGREDTAASGATGRGKNPMYQLSGMGTIGEHEHGPGGDRKGDGGRSTTPTGPAGGRPSRRDVLDLDGEFDDDNNNFFMATTTTSTTPAALEEGGGKGAPPPRKSFGGSSSREVVAEADSTEELTRPPPAKGIKVTTRIHIR